MMNEKNWHTSSKEESYSAEVMDAGKQNLSIYLC